MGSVREIAKRAQVSIATVSRVLNETGRVNDETRQRVLGVVNDVGYVRRVGRRAVAEGIALAYAGPGTIATPYDQGLLSGIGLSVADESAGEDFGNDLLIINLKRALRPDESPSALFRRKGIKGAILRSTDDGFDLCRQLARERFPFVLVGARLDDEPSISWIDGESYGGSFIAIEHLIELGHRRISVVANVRDDTDHRDRINGWRDAMTTAGLPTHDEPEAFPAVLRERAIFETGQAIIDRWLATPVHLRPSAIYIADPMPTIALLHAAHDQGIKIPRDLSIVGFSDGLMRRLTFPPIACVSQDARAIGGAAVDALRVLMAGTVRHRDDTDAAQPAPVRRSLPTVFEPGATAGPFVPPPHPQSS